MKPGWKKRGRSEEALARKPGKVPPRLLHLIVCEDAVATPRYFKALRSKLKLSTAEVEVCGEECGSAPINVVDYAIQRGSCAGTCPGTTRGARIPSKSYGRAWMMPSATRIT